MKIPRYSPKPKLLSLLILAIYSLPVQADYTTVDISDYLNANYDVGAASFPIGLSTGNTGTGIPFSTARLGATMGSAAPTSNRLVINLSSLNLSGQFSFYLLLNNIYGTPCTSPNSTPPSGCTNEYNVILNFRDGRSDVFRSEGGLDTRDYNNNPLFTNTISNTTGNWWTNSGTQGTTNYQRLDVRTFDISSTSQISNITIEQLVSRDLAILSGVTFSTLAAVELPSNSGAPVTLVDITNAGLNAHRVSQLGVSLNPTFAGGTLTVESNGTISQNFIVLASGGKLNLNGKEAILSGSIASLTGAAGTFSIENGHLVATGINSSFSGALQILEGANLSVSSASNLGTGAIHLIGNTARTVTATLSSTADMTISNPITVAYDPTFDVASGTTLTIDSVIADGVASGDVVITGGGTANLTNVNTYTGTTTINNGSTLTLSGSGSIAATSILTNHGVFNISPKASNTSLTGNYVQQSTGTLAMSLAPSNNQKLLISGTANLAGNLSLNASSGSYGLGRYTLITATGGVSGTFNSLTTTNLASYTTGLAYDANNVYLLLSSLGPSSADTQSSLALSANRLNGIYNLQSTAVVNGLTYDCQLFDVNNICLSTGGRYSNNHGASGYTTSALLIGGYRIDKNIRVGAWVDQNLSTNSATGTSLSNSKPLFGVFGAWAENPSGEGYEVKVSASYGDRDLTVTRDVIGTSEAGSGSTRLNTQAISSLSSYGFKLSNDVLAIPYVGVQYSRVASSGYTEASTADVTAPLTYGRLSQENVSILAGLKLSARLDPKTALFGSVGIEQNVNNKSGQYSATGVDGLTAVDFNSNVQKTRATASAGVSYDIDKKQRVSLSGIYREEAFNPTATTSVFATYTVGL